MSERILVTGATGFIGHALSQRLNTLGHEVIALSSQDGDISERATWQNLPAARHVFHLAARSFVPDSWEDPAGYLKTNVQGTVEALEYCRQHKAGLTFTSSYLYGIPQALPIPESAPLQPNNPYAQSKFMAEQACRFYAEQFNLAVTSIRPFNIYGRGQRDSFLIPTIVEKALHAPAIRVKDLVPKRDYLYLEDLVSAMLATMHNPRPGEFRAYNIGSGLSYSVAEVIDVIQQVLGMNKPVETDGEVRRNEVPDARADISLAKAELDWAPQYSFEEGIKSLLEREST